jgi:hypothetical protein
MNSTKEGRDTLPMMTDHSYKECRRQRLELNNGFFNAFKSLNVPFSPNCPHKARLNSLSKV